MKEFPLSNLILNSLLKDREMLMIDCGAWGGSFGEWESIADHLIIYGFDPDVGECARLNGDSKAKGQNRRYYPLVLGGKNEHGRDFYVTNQELSNSLLRPNESLIRRYRGSFNGTTVGTTETVGIKKIIKVDTVTLDTWAQTYGISDMDFIKLDVQGAELEILSGGKKLLDQSIGTLVEVWFDPIYHELPLFRDIDHFLRGQGFTFFSFHVYNSTQFVGRTTSPVSFDRAKTHWEQKLAGQLITADALYLRDPIGTAIPNILHTPEKLLKLACLAEMCGQIEYAFEVLSYAKAIVQDQDSVRRIIEQGGRYYVANKKRFYKQASLKNSGFARRLLQSNLGKAIIKNNVGATTYRAARKLFFGW
jgi:FkbM family methyltransferase